MSTASLDAHTSARNAIFKVPVGPLPPISSYEERQWNRLSDKMQVFHNGFKALFRQIWSDAETLDVEDVDSLERFLDQADGLYSHLSMHHSIEEKYLFPILARHLPQFEMNGTHRQEHAEMHEKLEVYHKYLLSIRRRSDAAAAAYWSLKKFHEIMKEFEDVLFGHMDDEVRSIGGESLRRSGMTLEELKALPM